MNDKLSKIVSDAAQNTTAINSIVGIQKSELAKSLGKLLLHAARNPSALGGHAINHSRSLLDVLTGKSEITPDRKDRRFKEPTWHLNPVYKRLFQSWAVTKKEINDWISASDIPEDDKNRVMFLAELITDALAPSNSLVGNPAAVKKLFETGGSSLLSGLKNVLDDLSNNGGMPSQVDKDAFTKGETLAASEGGVVYKNEILELIQYKPKTKSVYEIPILICPPQINKFYVFDLSPEKSLVRFLVERGYQVFIVSWRNPGTAQSHWGLENYVQALIDASDAILRISKSKRINVCGACSGGITLSTFLSVLAERDDNRVNSFTLQVCVLDNRREDSEIGLFLTDHAIEGARRKSKRKGILEGKQLARSFAWMRPNDLIWNYVVNNYLMGDDPPAFDVLYWNSDTTNLPAKLHSDYLDMYSDKRFQRGSEVEFMGGIINLENVCIDGYIQGALTDHITPWQAVYRNTGLFGGTTEFVLSHSGHIQSLVNPPGNPRAQYFTNSKIMSSPDEWKETAELQQDSWWLHWDKWLGERSGELKNAPRSMGNRSYPVIYNAPGKYLLDEA